jgi:hypothetical protein
MLGVVLKMVVRVRVRLINEGTGHNVEIITLGARFP